MNVPTFNEIWDEILSQKIIKKHKQYGNSLEEPALTFNKIDDLQLLINIRLDDKLKRMEMLDDTDDKYWSEIKEIIAYMMWKLYLKKEAERFADSDRQQGDKEQSSEDPGEDYDDRGYLRFLGLRRLPDK
jgi:hypothetical protein